MKKYRKLGEKFILPKKLRVLEVVEDRKNVDECSNCYYYGSKKCQSELCCFPNRPDNISVHFEDITTTLSESDQLLLERGLLKL